MVDVDGEPVELRRDLEVDAEGRAVARAVRPVDHRRLIVPQDGAASREVLAHRRRRRLHLLGEHAVPYEFVSGRDSDDGEVVAPLELAASVATL